MKVNRILENRKFSSKGDLYKNFEKKIVDALYLERKIMMMKFGKREQYQSRIQLIVFLVSCLEYFLEEVFKKSLENGLISIDKLKKEKNLSFVKANIKDLDEITKNKIKISEILAEEMNFQNIKDIILLGDSLNIVKYYKKINEKRKKEKLPELKKELSTLRKKLSPKIEKEMTKFILRDFGIRATLPNNEEKLARMIYLIKRMIFLRHKIVHKAHTQKIDEWESLAYTLATVQLAFFINECYKIELNNLKKKK